MKALLVASAMALGVLLDSLSGNPAAWADSGAGVSGPHPPFIDHTGWALMERGGRQNLTSLRVYPTAAGRVAARQPETAGAADEAWAEVLALSPDADTAGMRAQFLCHWQFAEFAHPGKISWNLEPWRPVVDDSQMFASGCNPGGSGEPF
jgi:hypothetical protein